MLLISVFFGGLLCGLLAALAIVMYIGSSSLERKKKALLEKIKNEDKRLESLESRMTRVKEITKQQLELSQQAEGPQKNSLHGKYKNTLVKEMKALDEEKTSILKSILADGHDPELTTIDQTGVVSKMKLSEYMAYLGITMEPQKSTAPTSKQMGKFTVIRGGKDDGEGTTH